MLPFVEWDVNEPDPNAPSIELYLRPANKDDATGIALIYNHYVVKSFIPEDQEEVSTDFIVALIDKAMSDSVPFLVAIKGQQPPPAPRAQPKYFGKRHAPDTARDQKAATTSSEMVIGFSMVEALTPTCFVSSAKSRSRLTAKLHFYTHPEYLRKGVGRCILDRTLACTSSAHCDNGSYPFVNAKNDPVYQDQGGNGPRRFHQLLLERAVERKDDPDYAWIKVWLEKRFYFNESCRLTSVGRSAILGTANRFLDVVQFQYEATSPGEFIGWA